MIKYKQEKKEKLANTIIFLAEKIPDLSKTKLLKLLYLLEEDNIKKYGVPFLDIEFELWKAGPVNRDVFIELSDTPIILRDYIDVVYTQDATYIRTSKKFSDDEFSDRDIAMLESVVNNYGNKKAKYLVQLLHDRSGAWYYFSKKYGLLQLFESGIINSSNELIDFEDFYCKTDSEKERYTNKKEFNKIVDNYHK